MYFIPLRVLCRTCVHQICKRQCLFIPTEQDVAVKFFRTISSHGKRPDPAERASMHSTRVRSAVMTPSRKQREEKNAQSYFQHLARLSISCESIQLDTVTSCNCIHFVRPSNVWLLPSLHTPGLNLLHI